MHGEGFFFQAFVYLAAAVVSVPLAKRLGMGSVLGYLLAGVVIGPFGLGLVGEEGQDVMQFAEFGVVMMLFLIGLELRPQLVWKLRVPILGMGGLQVTLTALVVAACALAVGLDWRASMAIGLILALSSTAIVLQTLNEKGLMPTAGGQASFSVLLFQDLAVIPILAILPLLAVGGGSHGAEAAHGGSAWMDALSGWGRALVVLGAVGVIVVGGRFLLRPVFRFIAGTGLREIFTAAALLLVIGIALLMTQVGLSPALGTFVAGVVMADSEYRHELESDIDPFKGLLLGLFFIAVGAATDLGLVAAQPGLIAGLVGALFIIKFFVLLGLAKAFRLGTDPSLLFAFALAQGGEFAFVLFSFATQSSVLPRDVAALLVAVVALSMAATPLLLLAHERLVAPRVGTRERERRRTDAIDESNRVIIAGFGRFGQIVGRLLNANGVGTTVLDLNPDRVDLLRRVGFNVFYGDATRHDLLRAAGVERAELVVLALDDQEELQKLARTVKKHHPHVKVLARAFDRESAYELLDQGVEHIYRETLDTAVRVGIDAMRMLGFRAHRAHRAAHVFRKHDEQALREGVHLRHDRKRLIDFARERIRHLEQTLKADQADAEGARDAGWDTDSLRKDFGRP